MIPTSQKGYKTAESRATALRPPIFFRMLCHLPQRLSGKLNKVRIQQKRTRKKKKELRKSGTGLLFAFKPFLFELQSCPTEIAPAQGDNVVTKFAQQVQVWRADLPRRRPSNFGLANVTNQTRSKTSDGRGQFAPEFAPELTRS